MIAGIQAPIGTHKMRGGALAAAVASAAAAHDGGLGMIQPASPNHSPVVGP